MGNGRATFNSKILSSSLSNNGLLRLKNFLKSKKTNFSLIYSSYVQSFSEFFFNQKVGIGQDADGLFNNSLSSYLIRIYIY